MKYAARVKLARMTATRAQLNGGRLELLTDFGRVLSLIELGTPCGEVTAEGLRFGPMPIFALALTTGRAAAARIVVGSEVCCYDMSIGTEPGKTDIVIDTIDIKTDNVIKLVSMGIQVPQ